MVYRLIPLIVLLGLLVSSQLVLAKTTAWLSDPIILDGQPDDWYSYPRTHIEDLGLSYSVVNDSEYLYLLVQKTVGRMPGMNRVRIWINSANDKVKDYGFVLQGPAMIPQNVQTNPDMQQRMQIMKRQQMHLDEGLYFLDYETSYPSRIEVGGECGIEMHSSQINATVTMYEMRIPLHGDQEHSVPPLVLDSGQKFRVGFECLPPMSELSAMSGSPPAGRSGGGGRAPAGSKGGGRGGGRGGGGPVGEEMGRSTPQIDPVTKWVKFKLVDQDD